MGKGIQEKSGNHPHNTRLWSYPWHLSNSQKLFSEQWDGETTTTCFFNLQDITLLHSLVDDLVRFRIFLVICILAVLIDGASILLALIQEVELYYGCAGCISLTAYKPVISTLALRATVIYLAGSASRYLESSQSQATSRMNWKASSYFS